MSVDLSRPQRIHIVGAGGAGMSAIGIVLVAMGHQVSGSDLKSSPALERLRIAGARVYLGHDARQVDGTDLLAVSTAIRPQNPEVLAARERGVPVLRRSEILAAITAERDSIAVAGTHGKTTTSSMLALVLIEAGCDPGFIIGGDVNEIGSGAAMGSGKWMVVEADESDGTFLELHPRAAIVTNVEPDHLDHYGSFDALAESFLRFADSVPGPVILCADDQGAARVARDARVAKNTRGANGEILTYGLAHEATFRILDPVSERHAVRFGLRGPQGELGEFSVPLPGLHIARNATAAVVAGLAAGADLHAARRALARFSGVARRFQLKGSRHGVTFVDDYAHLPGEIEATVAAARTGGWERVVCAFQPHRYSRIGSLWESYEGSFDGADLVLVTDIYSAGEDPVPGVSGELVVRSLRGTMAEERVEYLPGHGDLVARLAELLRPGDLCLALSAGDMVDLAEEVYPE